MDSSVNDSCRNITGIGLLNSIVGGLLMGISAYALKTGLASSFLALDASIILLILNPLILLAAILALAGFFLLQMAMHKCPISVVTPVSSGLGMVLPIIIAYFLLGEVVVFGKGVGIVLILIGIAVLGRKE